MYKKGHKLNYLIILIYVMAFLFFVFKMFFYAQYYGRFPDEMQHISYIAYLEKNHTVIPDFNNMKILEQQNVGNVDPNTLLNNKNIVQEYNFGSSTNYLGHPPLYYQIMRLSRAVHVKDNLVSVNLFKLRCFNIALSSIGLILILYMGYKRIGKNPILHWLYATIIVSVPMLAYGSAGINNDSLALVGLAFFLLGLLRFAEKKRNFVTYLIISLGVFIAFMSKLTSGLVVTISLLSYLILIIIKEKNAWFLVSKEFISTIPIYIVTVAYFLIVKFKTGSIQPTYKLLDPTAFYNSSFYVAVADRTHMGFGEYMQHFTTSFAQTWTGILSTVSFIKTGTLYSINSIGLLALLFIPIILIFQFKRSNRNNSIMLVLISIYSGLAISAIIQFLRSYNEYINISGYLGGYQSRYYLCGIPVLALSITFAFKNYFEKLSSPRNSRKSKLRHNQAGNSHNYKKLVLFIICLLFICLLYYEDFIYFLIYFKDYI